MTLTLADRLVDGIRKGGRIRFQDWGRDHWSLLLYLESRYVNNRGTLELKHIQSNLNRHPAHTNLLPVTALPQDGSKYGIRLADGSELPGPQYDEWDCIDDIVHAGLAEDIGFTTAPRIRMTPLGMRVVTLLRTHRAEKDTDKQAFIADVTRIVP